MESRIVVMFVLYTFASTKVVTGDDATFGACLPGKESCSECYLTLKQSLLGRDDNIQRLSNAFFPPRSNIPEFVTVTYVFENSNESQIWYWTHDSSYLFFQFTTFQYLSLFFSKPAERFSQQVILTLNESCINAPNTTFRLLTQRLKNFIEKKSYNPSIDENYFARSEIDTEAILPLSTADYIVAFYVAGFVIVGLICCILLWTYRVTKHWDRRLVKLSTRRNVNKYVQSKIFSVAVTAGVLILYVLVLDIFAVTSAINRRPILHTRNVDDRALPYIVLTFDLVLNAIWLGFWTFSCGIWIRNYKDLNYATKESKEYLLLALSTVPPVLCLIVHLPYIAIAYINDASNATSMFIYYTLVVFTFFGTLDLTYGTYIDALIIARDREENSRQINGREKEQCCGFLNSERRIQNLSAIGTPLFALLILVLIGMTTAALLVIPISKAFTDTSNRLVGFYQTAVVLVGAYFVYTNVFKKKPTLERVIENRRKHIQRRESDLQWQNLTSDEKVTVFYSHIVDLLADYEIQAGDC